MPSPLGFERERISYAFLAKRSGLIETRAMAVLPIEHDALQGPGMIEILARVTAQVGEPDQAIALLQKLLAIPYIGPMNGEQMPLTSALLKLDRCSIRCEAIHGFKSSPTPKP